MTEEIEAHVLKKYEILQKLGKYNKHLAQNYVWLWTLANFIFCLGKGAYGIVWKAIDKRTKEIVALKKNFDAF